MGRKAKTDLETELKRIEDEARKKARQAEELRERIKRTRIDDFTRWCKKHSIDPMQFYKLAITAEWGSEVKALYDLMTAEPKGVIKPAKVEPELVKTSSENTMIPDEVDDDEEDEIEEEEVQNEDEEDIDEEADDGEIEEKEDEEDESEDDKESALYDV